MKVMAFVLFFLITVPVWDLEAKKTATEGQACNCTPITKVEAEKLQGFANAIQKKLDVDFMANCKKDDCKKVIEWAKDSYEKYPHCASFFMTPKNKIGVLTKFTTARIVNDMIENPKSSVFLADYPDIDKFCPGYKKMRSTIKVTFWAWIFENLAFIESTCNPKTSNNAPNVPYPPASGLYQLEKSAKLRGWRGPNCKVEDEKIYDAEANTACAMDILKSHLRRNKKLFGGRDENDKLVGLNYWEALNEPKKKDNGKGHPHNKFKRRMADFPLCNVKSTSKKK